MEESKLNIALKVYLDEKFDGMERRFDKIDHQVNLLDSKINQEHDKILTLEKDVSYFTEELSIIKKDHKECLENCNRRKADIDDRIEIIIEPRLKEAVSRLKVWIVSGVATVLLALVTYLIVNFFIPAVKNTETQKKSTTTVQQEMLKDEYTKKESKK